MPNDPSGTPGPGPGFPPWLIMLLIATLCALAGGAVGYWLHG